MRDSENKIFRCELKAIILPAIKFSFLGGLILFGAILYKENFEIGNKMIEAVLIFEAVMIPFILTIMLAGTYSNIITLDRFGISSRNPFSNSLKIEFISWEAIDKVSHKSIFGYKYYLLQSDSSVKTIWIPMRINNKSKFSETVRLTAGSNHIFSIELMKG
ncbi:MAG: hypothetical protein ABIK92_01730 [Pseudomonadota bacterium]